MFGTESSATAGGPGRPLASRVGRRAAVLVLLGAVVVGLAHLPTARAAVRDAAVGWLASRHGIDARIGRLDYNLLTLRAEATEVSLAAQRRQSEPFFEARTLAVDLAWPLPYRARTIESIEIAGPRIRIATGTDGRTNLPAALSGRTGGGSSAPLRIGRISVRDLGMLVGDRARGIDIEVADVAIDLRTGANGQLAGRISGAEPGRLRVDGWDTRLSRLDATLRYDGSRLYLEPAVIAIPGADLSVTAAAGLSVSGTPLEGVFEARLDLASFGAASRFAVPATGSLVASGRIGGTLADPSVQLQIEGNAIQLARMAPATLTADLRASTSRGELRALNVTAPWGAVRVQGRASGDGMQVTAAWQGVDVVTLLRAFEFVPPVAVTGTVQGNASASWSGRGMDSLSLKASTRLLPTTRGDGLALAGAASLIVDGARWTLAPEVRLGSSVTVAGRARGALDTVLARSTVGGRLHLVMDDTGVAASELRRRETIGPRIRGRLEADAELGGTFGAPTAAVALEGHDLGYGSLSDIALSANGLLSADGALVRDLALTRPDGGVLRVTDARLGRRGSLAGQVTAAIPQLTPLLVDAPGWLQAARGELAADGRLTGSLDRPGFTGDVQISNATAAGQFADRIDARLAASADRVEIEAFTLTQGSGTLSLNGSVDARTRRYRLQAVGRELLVRPCAGPPASGCPSAFPFSARADLTVDAEGHLDRPGGNVTVDMRDAAWDRYRIERVTARASLVEGVAVVTGELPHLSTRFDATVSVTSTHAFDLRLQGDAVPVANALGAADMADWAARVEGTVSPVLHVSSPDGTLASARYRIELPPAVLSVDGTPLELGGPATVVVTPGGVSAEGVSVSLGGAHLEAFGSLDASRPASILQVALGGDASDFIAAARLGGVDAPLSGSGRVAAVVRATGAPGAPVVEGSLTVDDGVIETGEHRVSGLALRAAIKDGWIAVEHGSARWQGAAATLSGRAPAAWLGEVLPSAAEPWLRGAGPGASATLAGRITASPTRLLATLARGQVIGRGQLSGSFVLEASAPRIDTLSGSITVDEAELVLGGARLQQATPAQVSVDGRAVRLAPWRIVGPDTDLTVEGTGTFDGTDAPLRVKVTGAVDLAPLEPLIGAELGGVITTDVQVTGSLARPRLAGVLELRDGAFGWRNPRLAADDIAGRARLDGDHVVIERVTGFLNGASFEASGTWGLLGQDSDAHVLRIAAERVPVQLSDGGPRGELDLDLQYSATGGARRLTGTLGVTPEPFRGSVSLIRQVLAWQGAASQPSSQARRAQDGPPIAFDVAVVSRDNLLVDSSFGRVEMAADLRLVGTSELPLLDGRVTILEDGVIRAGGKTYRVRRGQIEFTNRRRIEPRLDILAQTQVGDYRIAMLLTGTPDRLQTSLTSDPPLSEADLRSLLVTGRLASDRASGGDTIGQEQVVQTVSGDLFGIAANVIGLDSVSIGIPDLDLIAGDIDAETSINIRKTLTRRFEVFLSQALQDNRFSWMFVYRPTERIQLRFLSRDQSEGAVEFRQEFAFARPPVASTPGSVHAPHARTRAPRVTTVAFAGSPGVPEADLRERLKLGPGDRFDLGEWRADAARLEALYRERGLLAAQVRPRRTATPDGTGVALEYDVTGGPETVLRIEGHSFSEEAIAALRLVWSETVSHAFLVEDMQRAARRHLVDEGYLRSQVRADLRKEADRLELTLSIDPGIPSPSRSVDFTGNTALTDDELLDAIEEARLSRRMWRQGELVATLVAGLYRGLGYLDVDVRVGSPEFTDADARLPVAIDEGRRYTVAGVEVMGASALAASAVQKAAGMPVGTPYLAPTIEATRRAVQGYYLDRAFDEVEVQASSRVDRASGTATLAVTVDEGRRLVLHDVAITGPYRTRSKVVSDALELQRGTPLGPIEISAAQKRVYDTGAFASVEITPRPVDAAPAANGDLPVIADVKVQEAPRFLFRYGVQLSREPDITGTEDLYSVGAGFDFRDRSFLGRAISAGGGIRYDTSNQSARAVLSTPRTFGTAIRSNVFVTLRRELDNTSTLRGEDEQLNVTLEQRYAVRRGLDTSWGLAYDYRQVSIGLIQPREGGEMLVFSGYTVGPRTGVVWDTRDNPFNAKRGWFHSSNLDLGLRAIGSELDYGRYLLQQYVYLPAGPVVFASAVRWGTLRTFGRENLLSLDLRFKAGGGRTVRGYPEDSLSAEDFLGLPLGGKELLVLNQEVRFPIFGWLKGATFIDGGGTFGSLREIGGDGFRVGTGFGLRLDTPFALLRVDLGFPVNPRPEDKPRLHFSIGQAF